MVLNYKPKTLFSLHDVVLNLILAFLFLELVGLSDLYLLYREL